MSSDKINQLQLLQQNLQGLMAQKQQMQEQLTELQSALRELGSTEKAYKIVGKVMLATSKEELSKELAEQKDVMEVRLKNFTSQEEKLKKSLEETQKDVMKEMKEKKDGD